MEETVGVDRTFTGLIWELRPWQWYKQSVVLLGIVFSGSLLDTADQINSALAVGAFCLVAGGMYVFNDISDVEADRNHPTKQHRPIASGQVGVPLAIGFGLFVLLAGVGMAVAVNRLVLGVVLVYVVQNVLYNLALKQLLFVDILSIAVGFVLRAVAGAFAVNESFVVPSPWLVVCTLLAALMLAIGKRRREFDVSDGETRASLEEYDPEVLDRLLVVVTATLLMAYSMYTFFGAPRAMMMTLPFAYFATFRYHHLVVFERRDSRIERMLLLDRPFLINGALWLLVVFAVIYFPPELVTMIEGAAT